MAKTDKRHNSLSLRTSSETTTEQIYQAMCRNDDEKSNNGPVIIPDEARDLDSSVSPTFRRIDLGLPSF